MDAKQLLGKYRKDRQKMVEELRQLDAMVRRLESDLGEQSEDKEDLEITKLAEQVGPPQSQFTTSSREVEIKPDDFFGMSQGDAARKYLEMVGHAVELEKLVEVLKKGGCKVGGADPKRTLYISLIRDTRNFVPPQPGYIGLRKFYPHLKAVGTKPISSSKKAKKRKRSGKRGTASGTKKEWGETPGGYPL